VRPPGTPARRVRTTKQSTALWQLRNRWRRPLFATAALSCAGLVTIAAIGAYSADQLVGVRPVEDTYPLRVTAVNAARTAVTLTRGPDAGEPGSFRLSWPGGHATVGAVLAENATTVSRAISSLSGRLTVAQTVGIQPDPYAGNPRTSLGIPFENVFVSDALGPMPAWFINGRRKTWVLLIHGLDGSRSDTLPPIPTLHALGFPLLAISYRNDAGAARSLDHRNHLGDTEWHDIEAAIRYAIAHGAAGVVLYGWSLGAGMGVLLSEQSPLRGAVRALILDSPLLDWPATLAYGARQHEAPSQLTWITKIMLRVVFHVNLDPYDAPRLAAALSTPTLLVQGTADRITPPSVAYAFAHARPDLITYLPVSGADHVSSIDTDPSAYNSALRRMLAPMH
jgi:pimeloyl-ACP methyl ester carboxylesterase